MSETQDAALAIEQVLIGGDLAKLTATQRLRYYKLLCEALKLNYLTRPFEYITINGKMLLYARRDATDQLRRIHGIAIEIVSRERYEDAWIVTARARSADGRTDESIGAVSLVGLKGLELANALMKAETKAKRRVTLSIVGLGWSDETEIEGISGALLAGTAIKQIAPVKKFSELTDGEKRERLAAGWHKLLESMNGKASELPLPDFEQGELNALSRAAGLLAELAQEEDNEKISVLVESIKTVLNEGVN